jgi:hypothetical protein
MSDSPSPTDQPAPGHEPAPVVAGDDLLPPVEPPSAGFIVQLFVVPALIVIIVVAIWVLFTWLVHRTTMQPQDLIQGLRSSSVARWQRASELADMLRNDRFADFRQNGKAAQELADIFDREIDSATSAGGMDEENVTLRYFLARALGEFRVDEGLDVLLKAATTNRDPREAIVRRGAVQAIAVRASNLAEENRGRKLSDPELDRILAQLAKDEDKLVRSEMAFTLGQISTPASELLLEEMVDDPHADTRYNAAIALAQRGNAAGLEVLAEMLDPAEMTSITEEPNEQAQFFKRSLIISNALEAVGKLATTNPNLDFAPVIDSLNRISTANADELHKARISRGIVPRAREALGKLQSLSE